MTQKNNDDLLTYNELLLKLDEADKELDALKTSYSNLTLRVQKLISNNPTALLIVDRSNCIQAVNSRTGALFEYSQEELSKKPLKTVFPELEEVKEGILTCRTLAKRKSGIKFPVELFINEFEIKGQHQLIINVVDITERQRLEQLRMDLVSMVSHDIRGPLTAVKLYLDILKKGNYGEVNARGLKGADVARSTIDYLNCLVRNLLDSDHIENGTIEIVPRETSIGAIVKKAIDTTLGAQQGNTVTIEEDFTNDCIEVDEEKVVQVLINLISNAIKFSPDNSSVKVVAGIEGLMAKFQVIDSGPGIAKDRQSIIFEKYRQLDQTVETKRQGFGLGLAICKALVEEHGGQIGVESSPDKGSNFYFVVPIS